MNFSIKYRILTLIFLVTTSCGQNEEVKPIDVPILVKKDLPYSTFIGKDYLIDSQHSYLGFKIKYFGFSPVRGRFDMFDGTLFYDENDLSSISITVFIDLSSINTGNKQRDEDLKKEGSWFDISRYQYAIFQSTEVIPLANDGFNVIGVLKLKGIEKILSIKFSSPTSITKDWARNDQVDFSGNTNINRKDFGIEGEGFWSTVMENGLTQLSDAVEIEIEMHCRRPDYIARHEDSEDSDVRKQALKKLKESGVELGIELIDSLYNVHEINSGALSTIGNTLNTWKMHAAAKKVFEKKLTLFGPSAGTFNQLAITQLFNDSLQNAKEFFLLAEKLDSTNSRATEYLRLIEKMDK